MSRTVCRAMLRCMQPFTGLSHSRSKVTELEAKLRAAVQDKNSAQNEKAAAERELKAMRSQAERLTKNMDKVGLGKVDADLQVGANRTILGGRGRSVRTLNGDVLGQAASAARCECVVFPPCLLQITGVEEKKRESIMVGFNQTKSRLQVNGAGVGRVLMDRAVEERSALISK